MTSYEERLSQIGLTMIGKYTGAKNHHTLKCSVCEHQWSATPVSKMQAYKKTGKNGCPNCNEMEKASSLGETRASFIRKIEARNITILTEDYDGSQTTTKKIKVRFNECGHDNEVAPGNIIHRNVKCIVCSREENATRNQSKHDIWALIALLMMVKN